MGVYVYIDWCLPVFISCVGQSNENRIYSSTDANQEPIGTIEFTSYVNDQSIPYKDRPGLLKINVNNSVCDASFIRLVASTESDMVNGSYTTDMT